MKATIAALAVLTLFSVAAAPSFAQMPGFGFLYYDDQVVRTVVPPAAAPLAGRDNLYVVVNGVAGQLGIAGVAPGDSDYHGGEWALHEVTWNVAPHLLTSEAAVLSAAASGEVTVTRVPGNDFRCPIQP